MGEQARCRSGSACGRPLRGQDEHLRLHGHVGASCQARSGVVDHRTRRRDRRQCRRGGRSGSLSAGLDSAGRDGGRHFPRRAPRDVHPASRGLLPGESRGLPAGDPDHGAGRRARRRSHPVAQGSRLAGARDRARRIRDRVCRRAGSTRFELRPVRTGLAPPGRRADADHRRQRHDHGVPVDRRRLPGAGSGRRRPFASRFRRHSGQSAEAQTGRATCFGPRTACPR